MACHHTHVAVGLLSGVAIAGVMHLGAESMAVFALCSGGASLLPDLDTPTSAASHAGGVLLKAPLALFRFVLPTVNGSLPEDQRKHRGLTHVGLAAVGFALGIYLLSHLFTTPDKWLPAYWPIRIVVPALLAMLAVRSVMTFGSGKDIRPIISHRHRFYLDLLVGLVVGYMGYHLGSTPRFATGIALACAIGYFSHLLVDAVMNGVPLLWPLTGVSLRHRFTLGHIETGGFIDHLLGWVCLFTTLGLFFWATPLGLHLFGHLPF
jgi:hypothetical protein